jgi:hypothetical protein
VNSPVAPSRAPFVAAALGLLGGWLLLRPIHGRFEPGIWWTSAHALWLLGFVAIVPVGSTLRRMAGGSRVADVAAGAIVLSALANVAQMVLDLVAGAGGAAAVDGLRDIAWVDAVVYSYGAQLVFLGLLVMAVLLAVRHVVTVPAAAAVVVGVLMIAATFAVGRNHPIVPAGMVVFGVGLVALTVRARVRARHSTSIAVAG